MAGIHDYRTPAGEFHEVRNANGSISFEIVWNPGFGDRLSRNFNNAQAFVDTECLRLCEPKVPKDTGILVKSGILNTIIGNGEIRYRTPYARRWYYRPAQFQGTPERGNYWFERMKQEYRQQILAGARRLAGK